MGQAESLAVSQGPTRNVGARLCAMVGADHEPSIFSREEETEETQEVEESWCGVTGVPPSSCLVRRARESMEMCFSKVRTAQRVHPPKPRAKREGERESE